jgi:hypothetical protein
MSVKKRQYDEMEADAEKQGFTLAEKRQEIENKRLETQRSILELTEHINDRTKFGNEELAQRAAEIMGVGKIPRGLSSIRTLTPALMAAYRVRSLEDQAKVATAYGNSGLASHLQSEADRVRGFNPALKFGERYPIEKTQFQIQQMSEAMKMIEAKLQMFPTPP